MQRWLADRGLLLKGSGVLVSVGAQWLRFGAGERSWCGRIRSWPLPRGIIRPATMHQTRRPPAETTPPARAERIVKDGGGFVVENKSAERGKSSLDQRNRNPLGAVYFPVATELVDSGLGRQMGGCELRRYLTLLRIGNSLGSLSSSVSLENLANIDGVSPRSAFRVNGKLAERGLVSIDWQKNPMRYTLMLPEEWIKPPSRVRLVSTASGVRTEERVEAPKWR